MNTNLNQKKLFQKMKNKLPILNKQRSKSSQMKIEFQSQLLTDTEQTSLNKCYNLKPLFKSIHDSLCKSPIKREKKIKTQLTYQQASILKLSQLVEHEEFIDHIGVIMKNKIGERKMESFKNIYEKTMKYSDEEDININRYSNHTLMSVNKLKQRKKFVLEQVRRKSPRFLFPLGSKIRVPNESYDEEYFPLTHKSTIVDSQQVSPKQIDNDINVSILDGPPKKQLYPTSSMAQDYFDIKINSIKKSMMNCQIYKK